MVLDNKRKPLEQVRDFTFKIKALTLKLLAVFHVGLPVTGLLVDVKGQARWTT